VREGRCAVTGNKNESAQGGRTVLLNRRFVTCGACGWVHYVMTAEEKEAGERLIARYHLSERERLLYESAFRQCLRCEAPVSAFRAADESDLDRAEGHVVTPVFVEVEGGPLCS
jgi:hypothetical protein